MTYTTAQGREQLLNALAQAADELGSALASLGEAYEQLDERSADALEQQLFIPVQSAYGRAQREHNEFATRHDLPTRAFPAAPEPAPGQGAKALVGDAVEACARADGDLAELQDSMLPVEVGDADLRAGLAAVRTLIGNVRSRARDLLRTFGR